MTRPDPKREPKTETSEKPGIVKTHEEFTGKSAQPSLSKKEYEERKKAEEAGRAPSDRERDDGNAEAESS